MIDFLMERWAWFLLAALACSIAAIISFVMQSICIMKSGEQLCATDKIPVWPYVHTGITALLLMAAAFNWALFILSVIVILCDAYLPNVT